MAKTLKWVLTVILAVLNISSYATSADVIGDVVIDEFKYTLMSDGSAIFKGVEESEESSTMAIISPKIEFEGTAYVIDKIYNRAFLKSAIHFAYIPLSVKSIVTSSGQSVSKFELEDYPNYTKLRQIICPEWLSIDSSIYECPFSHYISVIKYTEDNPIEYVDGVFYNQDRTQLYKVVESTTSDFQIPEGVQSIGPLAFQGCEFLKSIKIPNSVHSIGGGAFANCKNLSSVVIPSNIKSLESYRKSSMHSGTNYEDIFIGLFEGCEKLSSLILPSSIISIESKAFAGTNIESLTIPENVIEIGQNITYNCKKLQKIYFNARDCNFVGGINSLYSYEYVPAFPNEEVIIQMGENVETIPKYMYYYRKCSVIDIHNGIKKIGDFAFKGSEIIKLDLPASLEMIGNGSFSDCAGLTSVTIPNSVPSIGDYAFSGCSGLTSVTMSLDALRNLGGYTFENCTALTSLILSDFNPSYYYAYYKENSFSNCVALKELKILGPLNFYKDDLDFIKSLNFKFVTMHKGCTGFELINKYIKVNTSSVTQRTAKFYAAYNEEQFEVIDDNGVKVDVEIRFNGQNFIVPSSSSGGKYFTVSNLCVKQDYPVLAYGVELYTISTKGIKFDPQITQEFADKVNLTASFDSGDCEIDKVIWAWEGGNQHEGWNVEIPCDGRSQKSVVCQAGYSSYTYNCYYTINYPDVKIENGMAQATSLKSARLSADINFSDGATAYVEWRRNDAPDNVPSQVVECPIVGQKMLGELRGLRDDVYYQFRPYVMRGEERTYGEWVGFYTGDANVYFAPEVNTMDARVEESSVTLAGYVLPGTDPVTSRGFEVRSVGASTRAGEEWVRYEATGTLMYCTPNDLAAGTDYIYRVYAETEKETIYGNEQTFSTPAPSAIENMEMDGVEGEMLQVVLQRNPVVEHPVVKIISTEQTANVAIYSLDGALCFKDVVEAVGSAQTLDVNLRPGMYLLEAVAAGERKTLRMIVR